MLGEVLVFCCVRMECLASPCELLEVVPGDADADGP